MGTVSGSERGYEALRSPEESGFQMTKPSLPCRDEGLCGAGLMRKNECTMYLVRDIIKGTHVLGYSMCNVPHEYRAHRGILGATEKTGNDDYEATMLHRLSLHRTRAYSTATNSEVCTQAAQKADVSPILGTPTQNLVPLCMHKQLLENLRRKSLLPRLRNDRVIRLLGRLFRLAFRGFCSYTPNQHRAHCTPRERELHAHAMQAR
jgi:hypothetical protein